MKNYANFNVDWRKNKLAARGPHIHKFVILAATLCCDNLNISWRGKLTLNIFTKYSPQVGKWWMLVDVVFFCSGEYGGFWVEPFFLD